MGSRHSQSPEHDVDYIHPSAKDQAVKITKKVLESVVTLSKNLETEDIILMDQPKSKPKINLLDINSAFNKIHHKFMEDIISGKEELEVLEKSKFEVMKKMQAEMKVSPFLNVHPEDYEDNFTRKKKGSFLPKEQHESFIKKYQKDYITFQKNLKKHIQTN
jgi:hypothetical protein